jgi:hypothetical protein
VEVLGGFWRGALPEEIEQVLTQAAEDDWEPVELAPIHNSGRLILILRRPAGNDRWPAKGRAWP